MPLLDDYNSNKAQWFATLDKAIAATQTALDKANVDLIAANATISAQSSTITSLKRQSELLTASITLISTQRDNLKAQLDALQKQRKIGVNTHPFNSPIYSDFDRLIKKTLEFGGKIIRANTNVTDAGMIQYEAKYRDLKAKCEAAGLILQLMINIDYGDVKRGYAGGQAIGKGLAVYGLEWAEIGNEWAIKDFAGDGSVRMLKTGDGDKLTDYDQTLMAQCAQCFKGVADALKAGSPQTKIILDGEWLHTAWNEYVIKTIKAPVDILAWHWYSEQQIARSGKEKIRDILTRLFPGLPLYWNEVGARPDKVTGKIPQIHIDAIVDFLIHDIPNDDVVLYELFDQPELIKTNNGVTNLQEPSYGLFDENMQIKPYGTQLKSVK